MASLFCRGEIDISTYRKTENKFITLVNVIQIREVDTDPGLGLTRCPPALFFYTGVNFYSSSSQNIFFDVKKRKEKKRKEKRKEKKRVRYRKVFKRFLYLIWLILSFVDQDL